MEILAIKSMTQTSGTKTANNFKNMLYQTIIGSSLYGLETKDSDIDKLTVNIESPTVIFGIQGANKSVQTITDESDERIFWLKRFVSLCVSGNPNTLESLWATQGKIIFVNPIFQKYILNNNHLFLTKNIINPHLGFAKSQVYKLTNKKFIGNKRKNIIDTYGYDIKYATHALRLIHQLETIINNNTLIFPVQNKDILLDIKLGNITRQKFLDIFNASLDAVMTKLSSSWLQKKEADIDKINALLYNLYKESGY